MPAADHRPLLGSVRAVASFWRSRELRPLGSVRAAGSAAEWMWYTSATVFAYQLGGVPAVGLIAVSSVLPAAILAPVLSYLIDRYPRHRVLTGAVALRATALTLAAGSYYTVRSVGLVAAFTAVEGVATLLVRPASTALLPFLTHRPAELVSAQATLGAVENGGLLVGSFCGGLLLSVTAPGVVFAVAAAIACGAVVASLRLRIEGVEATVVARGGVAHVVRESWQGFPAIVRNRAWVVSTFTLTTLFISGATEVLVVAIAFDLLGLADFGPGLLTACIGFGGIVGAAVMSGSGGRRLGPWLVAATVLIGAPLVFVAVLPRTGVVIVLMAVVGAGAAVTVVAGQAQLQRLVDEAQLGRALGVTEAMGFLALALGAAVTPALVEGLGLKPTLVVIGAAAPVVGLGLARLLWRVDDAVQIDLAQVESLDGIAFLDPLPNVTRARIASRVGTREVEAGTAVTTQGEPGDTFFIVDRGSLEVLVDRRSVRTLGVGDFFGEIALLTDEPRTATVRAQEPTTLRVLHRADFLTVVTGHAGIGGVVSEAADERRRQIPAGPGPGPGD